MKGKTKQKPKNLQQRFNSFGLLKVFYLFFKILGECQSSISTIPVVIHKKGKNQLKSYILEKHLNVWKHY